MGIALLKKLNSKMPDSLKLLAGKFIRNRLIHHEVFVAQYNFLTSMDMADESKIEQFQLSEIKKVLIHAYEHTVFYRREFDEAGFSPYDFTSVGDLKKIPVISKRELIEYLDEMSADDMQDFYSATTGGSTGTPVKIYLERNSIYRERAFIYHFWKKAGYDYKTSKLATFRGTEFGNGICKYNPLYNEIQLNPCTINRDTIRLYYDKIIKFGADYLHGFPGAIYSFCKFADEAGLDIRGRFKGAFFISENIYDFQREYVEQALGCRTYGFYGHTERAVFARQEEDGYYSFDPWYGFVEFSDGEEGNIICTGFLNQKVPLIRYEVDDHAERKGLLYHIEGHRIGELIGKNDEKISPAMLEAHTEALERVASYQFVQRKAGRVTVSVIPAASFEESDREAIREAFQRKFGGAVDVEVQVVDSLIYSPRGKYQLIVKDFGDSIQ